MIRVSVVSTTIGRPEAIVNLVRSLERAHADDRIEFILVDQSPDQVAAAALRSLHTRLPVRIATSAPGASVGRNAGAKLASGDILAFPDDGAEYPRSTLERVIAILDLRPDLDGLSAKQIDPQGHPTMLRWPHQPCDITTHNFYRTNIESTFFIRRSAWDELGGFDESYGTGSAGPYQSGEISDLVLRGLVLGHRYRYLPDLLVLQADHRPAVPAGYTSKMRGYGRGYGRLFRQHHLSPVLLTTLVARKVVAAGVRTLAGHRGVAQADLAWAEGLLWGYRTWHS